MTPTIFWICIIFGVFCAAIIAAFGMAMMVVASDADDQMEEFMARERSNDERESATDAKQG